MSYRFDACITYQFSFTLSESVAPEVLLQDLRRRFPMTVADHEPLAADDSVLRDIATVQGFLHGGGLPFECHRFRIRGLDLTFSDVKMTESAVLLSHFPEFNAAQLFFCFRAPDVNTDEMIYLRQIMGGAAQFTAADGWRGSLTDLYTRITDSFCCGVGNLDRMYLAEIKDYSPAVPLEQMLAEEKQRLYGMLSGDEGWAFVPRALAEERLTNTWGSRNFVKFLVFGGGAVLFNLVNSPEARAYMARQEDFGGRCYGGVNPYFLIDSPVAGVCHGILISQEMVVVIKTIANRILNHQSRRSGGVKVRLGDEIRRTKAFRAELITTINRVEDLGISEIGELEQMLLRSHKISPLIDSIKYLLELLESDLDLLYQQSTNRLVNILTVAGLVLTVVGVLVDAGLL